MTLIVENGSGVFGANTYVDIAYVTAYLTDRNKLARWTSAGATKQAAACVLATDYVEARWRRLFKGSKFYRDISTARATLTFTGQPTNTETVTIGTVVYQFVTAISSANDVLVGVSLAASIANLVDAVNANPDTAGTAFHASTIENADAAAQNFIGDALLATSKVSGTPGNAVATTTTVAAASWNFATLVGGSDVVVPQPLSFPRDGLYDLDGIAVQGIPERLKYVVAEYAYRSLSVELAPDPTVDALGGTVSRKREKVGPIEEETEYLPGSANSGTLPKYPAADRLMVDYIKSGGALIRG